MSNYIVYHHIFKTGGTSILEYFEKEFDEIEPNYIFQNKSTNTYYIHNHLSNIDQVYTSLNIEKSKNVRHIVSVRHPIDRFFSSLNHIYLSKRKMSDSAQFNWLTTNESILKTLNVTFIKTENLNKDFKKAFKTDYNLKKSKTTEKRFFYRNIDLSLIKTWETTTEKEKIKIREQFKEEYKLLKKFGIQYNIK